MGTPGSIKFGDIVSIKSPKKVFLVVRSEQRVGAAYDGNYYVEEIDVVPIDSNAWFLMFTPGVSKSSPYIFDAKPKSFYFEGGSMTGKGKPLNVSDVKVVGTCTLEKEVQITYNVRKAKYYG